MAKNQYMFELAAGYKIDFREISRILRFLTIDEISNSEQLSEKLGLSNKKSLILFGICNYLGLKKSGSFKLTQLGNLIADNDLYFDNLNTLWILHYIASSNPRLVVWNRLISNIIYSEEIITTDKALKYYQDLYDLYSSNTMDNRIPDELQPILRLYSTGGLSELNLIDNIGNGKYKKGEPKDIGSLAFCYNLLHFRDMFYSNSSGLEIKSIINEDNSPGRILLLEDFQVYELLNKLADQDLLSLETFGDLDQVRFSHSVMKESILNKIYGGNND